MCLFVLACFCCLCFELCALFVMALFGRSSFVDNVSPSGVLFVVVVVLFCLLLLPCVCAPLVLPFAVALFTCVIVVSCPCFFLFRLGCCFSLPCVAICFRCCSVRKIVVWCCVVFGFRFGLCFPCASLLSPSFDWTCCVFMFYVAVCCLVLRLRACLCCICLFRFCFPFVVACVFALAFPPSAFQVRRCVFVFVFCVFVLSLCLLMICVFGLFFLLVLPWCFCVVVWVFLSF